MFQLWYAMLFLPESGMPTNQTRKLQRSSVQPSERLTSIIIMGAQLRPL